MSNIEDGGPAFPSANAVAFGESCEFRTTGHPGLTLRDYFATHATDADIAAWMYGPVCLQIKTDSNGRKYEYHGPAEYTREQARYLHADAMLKARKS